MKTRTVAVYNSIMATRSFIAKQMVDGSVLGVYCHWDGYPENNGRILSEHYTDPKKVLELLTHGSISTLRSEIGERHDFENQVEATKKGWTTFYHRDRHEEYEENTRFDTIRDMIRDVGDMMGAEYAYVYNNGNWETYKL